MSGQDVVPCVTFKSWSNTVLRPHVGIRLVDDSAPWNEIVNYPKQHLDRGTSKNDRCQRRYKRVVRILKTLENEMVSKGIIEEVPSFAIESAVWNVRDADLTNPLTWTGRTRNALAHIYKGTLNEACVRSDAWIEANGVKFLFHPVQGWTWQELHGFTAAAWDYVGFD